MVLDMVETRHVFNYQLSENFTNTSGFFLETRM